MIWHPRSGQPVVLHYAKRVCALFPYHGSRGVVIAVSRGPGPINALIQLQSGPQVVVPRGNLINEGLND